MSTVPHGTELIDQLNKAITFLIESCHKNHDDFLHLPEFDEYYFERLIYFLDAALKIEKDERFTKAKELLTNTNGKYFCNVAPDIQKIFL